MNKQKHVFTAALFLAASTLTPALATPASAADLKPYVGLDYALIHQNNGSADGSNFNVNAINPYVGVQFNRYFAAELGYLDSDRDGSTFDGTALGGGPGDTENTKVQGFHLDALGSYPLTQRFDAIGTIGLARAKGRSDLTLGGAPFVAEETDTVFRLGVGGHYAVTEHVGLRSIIRRNFASDLDNFWQANVGVQYRF